MIFFIIMYLVLKFIWFLLQGTSVAVEGEPSSSAQHVTDHHMLSGSKQGVLIHMIASPIVFSSFV